MTSRIYQKKKLLAIASEGGHWIQLQRLIPAFSDCETVFVSTKEGYSKMVPDSEFYAVNDANRWTKMELLKMTFQIARVVFRVRPDIIISTGAAPGIIGICFGKLIGAKSIWIDSIANAEKLSMSGKIAKYVSGLHLTQWEHLAKGKRPDYKGKVIS